LGIDAWTDESEWSGSQGYVKAPIRKWEVDGKHCGNVKSYNELTILRVFDAGHMVPYDHLKHAFDIFILNQWIGDHCVCIYSCIGLDF